ncbi:MAG: helix-turn-helix domain-containing protein [Hyphomonadaceae bacterium]
MADQFRRHTGKTTGGPFPDSSRTAVTCYQSCSEALQVLESGLGVPGIKYMNYNQFCPIAKATEILGEKWTLLIIRELLMGATRFSELQRGLGLISPTLLTARLKFLEEQGLLAKRRIPGQKGYEYFPTAATKQLMPVILAVGEWGIIWARHNLLDADFDVDLLMLYLERSIDPDQLVGGETTIQFRFADLVQQQNFWILVKGADVQLCVKDPCRDIDVFFTTTVRTMSDVWMGDRSYREAIRAGELSIQGPPVLTRDVSSWLRPSVFAEAPRTAPTGGGA